LGIFLDNWFQEQEEEQLE